MMENAAELRKKYPYTRPSVICHGPIIGLGYRPPWRLGNICQARFALKHGLKVMLAQQSAREIERTGRTFQDVIDSASVSASEAQLEIPWGADGDHLRNEAEVGAAARAGCTHFTYDVTADLKAGFDAVVEKVLKLNHLAHQIKCGLKFTTEISLDEGESTTAIDEITRLLSVLKEKHVIIDEIAPRFPGYFEKAIDYYRDIKDKKRICDTSDFEKYLKQLADAANANQFRVCIHSGSDKFSIYPIVSKILQKNFHLKTAGTYYLEDLKILARHDTALFLEIFAHSSAQFARDRASYELSANPDEIPDIKKLEGAEIARLLQSGQGNDNLRQVLHVTYGSILTARDETGKPLFGGRIEKVLRDNFVEYQQELFSHLGRHFKYFF
jgi:hypothetical protein